MRATDVNPERRVEDVKAAAAAALERFNRVSAEVTVALRDMVDREQAA